MWDSVSRRIKAPGNDWNSKHTWRCDCLSLCRNSDNLDNKRQSLNLDLAANLHHPITKSFTDLDLNRQFFTGTSLLTPTPTSPGYKQLGESSANTTPGFSPNCETSLSEITYQNLRKSGGNSPKRQPSSPNYENILTTISITYKSPPRSASASPMKSPVYENVILNAEKVRTIKK